MRVRRKKWTANELETNEKIVHNKSDYKGRWNEYFGNDNPIYLELGCGKGKFITNNSLLNENINYIALEKESHVIASATRLSTNINTSLAFIVGDVKDLEEFFDEKEISRIYINFCDPWENKNKWAKRRLTHSGFLKIYESILVPNGAVFFKTDNKNLFEFSLNEFANNDWKMKNITLDLHNSGYEGNIMTEYEEKFSSRGMNIYRCEAYTRS